MINPIIKYSLAFSFLVAFFLWMFGWGWDAAAFFIGTCWGAVNLYLIARVVEHVLITKRHALTIFWLLIKFPLLYLAGYFILAAPFWDPWFAAAGLVVIVFGIIAYYLLPFPLKENP